MKEPVAFSPREFAALFNKEQSWGYRQIYAGKVSTITKYGRILIPAAEVEKILASAGRYEGREQRPRTKSELEKMKPELQSAWDAFVRRKKSTTGKRSEKVSTAVQCNGTDSTERRAALRRLLKR